MDMFQNLYDSKLCAYVHMYIQTQIWGGRKATSTGGSHRPAFTFQIDFCLQFVLYCKYGNTQFCVLLYVYIIYVRICVQIFMCMLVSLIIKPLNLISVHFSFGWLAIYLSYPIKHLVTLLLCLIKCASHFGACVYIYKHTDI